MPRNRVVASRKTQVCLKTQKIKILVFYTIFPCINTES